MQILEKKGLSCMEYRHDLVIYRIQRSAHTLKVSNQLLLDRCYADSINRSYYCAFYAINAVHASTGMGYKRHKDAIGEFNKQYVATGKIDRTIGRDLSSLERSRNIGDYDDFRLVSKSDAEENFKRALNVFKAVVSFLNIDTIEVEIAYYVALEDIEDFKKSVAPSMLQPGNIEMLAEQYYEHKKEKTK